MPSSKRKVQSTVTLHDFFNAGESSIQNPKGKQKLIPINHRRATIAPENVIVIDSDSDSEPEVIQVIKTKRQRRCSGDVMFVNIKTRSATDVPLKVPENSEELPLHNRQDAKPSIDVSPSTLLNSASALVSPPKPEGKLVPSFGVPTLLLTTNATPPKTLSPRSPVASTVAFGRPTLLVGKQDSSASVEEKASSSRSVAFPVTLQYSSPSEKGQKDGYDPPSGVIDDWETGDDELVLIHSADEQEQDPQAISVYTSPRETVNNTKCPSCDMLLDNYAHLELVQHVNDCLDSEDTPSRSRGIPISEDEPLQPLSSHISKTVQEPQLISCDGKTEALPLSNGNAFSVLMSSHKDNEAWKEASVAEDRDFHSKKKERRKAPFYKILQGMPIAVDAFRYGTIPGINAYFLTHAHSDHYTNLASNWKSGPIYCSEGTANLIIHMLSVDEKWVNPLPYDVPTVILDTGGVRVTLVEANHCPGSSLFLFEGPQTVNAGDSAFKSPFVGSAKTFRYLHCGDFRASPQHVLHPAIKGKRIDHVYLDTTYLDPKYTFPPQPLVISACAELSRKLVSGESITEKRSAMDTWMASVGKNPVQAQDKVDNVLIVVGTYSIGKERIVKAIAHALKTKVFCDTRKAAILRCQADTELNALLTANPLEAHVHLIPLGMITSDKLKIYAERFKGHFNKVVGFRPTGWTYTQATGADPMPSVASIITRPHQGFTYASLRPARNSTPSLQLFPVPYSEHSSFFELTCFAMSFNWGKMIATVNVGSENSRAKMAKWVAKWEAERKKTQKDVIIPYREVEFW